MAEGQRVTDIVFIYVTHPDATAAAALARDLVEQGLAASVNILPGMLTVYRWQGRIETGAETVMIVKTRAALMESVQAHVRANHPYVCPCIAALPVTAGDPDYLGWIAQSTSP
jgi:periplasmic divalent cation tolerance protein